MKTYTLTVSVSDNWIADGFDFQEGYIEWLRENLIPYAYEDEVVVKVTKRPPQQEILELQGFVTT